MNTWSLSRTYPTFFYVYVFMFYIRSDILSRFLHVCFKLIKVMSLNSLHSEMLRLFRGHRILLWEAMFCWVSSLWSTWSGHIYRYPIEATRLSPPPHSLCTTGWVFMAYSYFAGGSKFSDFKTKSCMKADQCIQGSVNIGVSRTITTTKCCDSDLCNTQYAPSKCVCVLYLGPSVW